MKTIKPFPSTTGHTYSFNAADTSQGLSPEIFDRRLSATLAQFFSEPEDDYPIKATLSYIDNITGEPVMKTINAPSTAEGYKAAIKEQLIDHQAMLYDIIEMSGQNEPNFYPVECNITLTTMHNSGTITIQQQLMDTNNHYQTHFLTQTVTILREILDN